MSEHTNAALTHTSQSRERVPWVDYAKGICIILVVMMHTSNNVHNLVDTESFMAAVVAFARPFRMPDFFLVSGLFLGLVIARPWKTYLDKKVVHFAYFYVLWVLINFAFKAPAWVVQGTWSKFAELPMAFIEPLGTLWFIYVLPIFFVLTKLLHDKGINLFLVLAVAAALESAGIHTGWTVIDEFCARWVYFLAGYMFADRVFAWTEWVVAHKALSLALLAAWFVVDAVAVFAPNPLSDTRTIAAMPGISLLLGFAGAFAVVSAAALLERANALTIIRYCGQNSIVIYLAFFLTLVPLKYAVSKFGLPVGMSILAITGISVVFPLILHRLVIGTPLRFLFVRPAWCHIASSASDSRGRARTAPAA